LSVWRPGPGECLLFQRQVGVEVDLGGVDADVSEPEGDHAAVDAGVEESHGGGVPQDVRGDRFVVQGAATVGGLSCVVVESVFDGVAAEFVAAAGGEQWGVQTAVAFGRLSRLSWNLWWRSPA
jgi:hypothetical protein